MITSLKMAKAADIKSQRDKDKRNLFGQKKKIKNYHAFGMSSSSDEGVNNPFDDSNDDKAEKDKQLQPWQINPHIENKYKREPLPSDYETDYSDYGEEGNYLVDADVFDELEQRDTDNEDGEGNIEYMQDKDEDDDEYSGGDRETKSKRSKSSKKKDKKSKKKKTKKQD